MSDESPIIFTDSCCTKVADLIAEENNPDLKLRVFVNGGGCSGFQYGFTFDENRLHRKPARFSIRHPQSECRDNLRLRFVLLRINNPFLPQKTGRLYLQTACFL